MVKGKVAIVNEKGLHMKPAGVMSSIALNYPCSVYMNVREYSVNAKSVLGILSAQVKQYEEIELVCSGKEEEQALEALLAAARKGF